MKEKIKTTGSCLCGKVKIEASEVSPNIGACHCEMCRKWSGGTFLAVDCGEGKVSFSGESNISTYDSSEWAERGFCSQCGTNLYYRLKSNNQYMMPVALFQIEEADQLKFDHQIFIDEKPDYYDFANDTEKMTGAEVFAKFS